MTESVLRFETCSVTNGQRLHIVAYRPRYATESLSQGRPPFVLLCGRSLNYRPNLKHGNRAIENIEHIIDFGRGSRKVCKQCVRAFQDYRDPLQRMSEIQ